MNEPIVSPWLIYWAGRIDMVQGICLIAGIIVTIYAMIATFDFRYFGDISPNRKRNIRYVCCGNGG